MMGPGRDAGTSDDASATIRFARDRSVVRAGKRERRSLVRLAMAAASTLFVTDNVAAPSYRCMVDGTVTYQQGPCPSGEVRKRPTVQALNAEETTRSGCDKCVEWLDARAFQDARRVPL